MQVNKPLITGHKGFIGKSLLNKFDSSICVEKSFMNNEDWEVELAELVNSCDIIFHIGAIADTTVSDYNDMFNYNYYFSKVLFELAAGLKKKVIYSSSAAVYGTNGIPNSLYSWSKLVAEDYGMEICKDFVSLRYFNVYGPGEEHKGKMASVAYQAWKSGNFKLFPKKPKRDFVYIKDVVDANLHAVDCNKGIYEVGTSQDRTFEDVLDNMQIEYEYHPENKIPSWYQFNTKADSRDWLPGWSPKYNIETGINDYKKYLNGEL